MCIYHAIESNIYGNFASERHVIYDLIIPSCVAITLLSSTAAQMLVHYLVLVCILRVSSVFAASMSNINLRKCYNE